MNQARPPAFQHATLKNWEGPSDEAKCNIDELKDLHAHVIHACMAHVLPRVDAWKSIIYPSALIA